MARGEPANANGALERRIGSLMRDRLQVEVPSVDTDLLASGLIDSLALVEMIMLLEQDFRIRVAAEDLDPEHFRSIARIAAFVQGQSGVGEART